MGGDYPMIEDFLNIDFEAKKGIKGSVFNVSQYIPNTKKLMKIGDRPHLIFSQV